jgi:hypothetical protein
MANRAGDNQISCESDAHASSQCVERKLLYSRLKSGDFSADGWASNAAKTEVEQPGTGGETCARIVDTAPPVAHTKPGLLSYKSFNQKNHSADNTPTSCYPPKKPGNCHGLFFWLQPYTLKQVTGEYGSGELR